MSIEEFQTHIQNNDFIEWEEVYQGTYYGTLKSEVQKQWDNGKCVVFDVDVVGGLNLKSYFGKQALAIFVKPPSLETLKSRLTKRQTETEETLKLRLAKAEKELSFESQFDVTVLNDDLEEAMAESKQIISEFLQTEV